MQFLCKEQNQQVECLAMVPWFAATALGMPRQLSFKLRVN